jgi:hypothetical protein
MRVVIAGIPFHNPVIAASGTFGYGVEFDEILSLDKIGGFVTKGLSPEPMAGNPTPRIITTAAGMMNAIGLQNIGVNEFIEKTLPQIRALRACRGGTIAIANIFGFEIGDYLTVIRALNEADGISAYELNASCPNTRHGGMVFGLDARLRAVRSMQARMPSHSSILFSRSRLIQKPAARASPTLLAGCPAPPSSPSPCAWCMRRRAPCRFPSSAWAAFHPLPMQSNSCSPAPPPCRSAPPATAIRER